MDVDVARMDVTGRISGLRFTTVGLALLLWTAVMVLPGVCADMRQAGPPRAFATSRPATVRFPALVDVGSRQCIPCKMMEPDLNELKAEYARVLRVEFIEVEVNPEAAKKLGVRVIPTQIFYDASGKERHRHVGYMSKENILKTFRELGVELSRKDTGRKTK